MTHMQRVDGEAVEGELPQARALVQQLEHAVAVATGQGAGATESQALAQVQALELGQLHRNFHQHHAPLQVAHLHNRGVHIICSASLSAHKHCCKVHKHVQEHKSTFEVKHNMVRGVGLACPRERWTVYHVNDNSKIHLRGW